MSVPFCDLSGLVREEAKLTLLLLLHKARMLFSIRTMLPQDCFPVQMVSVAE